MVCELMVKVELEVLLVYQDFLWFFLPQPTSAPLHTESATFYKILLFSIRSNKALQPLSSLNDTCFLHCFLEGQKSFRLSKG